MAQEIIPELEIYKAEMRYDQSRRLVCWSDYPIFLSYTSPCSELVGDCVVCRDNGISRGKYITRETNNGDYEVLAFIEHTCFYK